jgi:hypothetical protein
MLLFVAASAKTNVGEPKQSSANQSGAKQAKAGRVQLAMSPVRTTVESALVTLRTFSPSAFKMLMPLVEQLSPVLMDVAQGRQEFTPSPSECDRLLRTYYNVSRNLLIRFKDDKIDETARLTTMLQHEAAISGNMDLTLRTLPGDHMRPLTQNFVDIPPDVARFANSTIKTSGTLIGVLPSRTPLECLWHTSQKYRYCNMIFFHVMQRTAYLCRRAVSKPDCFVLELFVPQKAG